MQRGKCNNDSELCAWNDERWAQVVPTVHIEMQPCAARYHVCNLINFH